MVIVLSLLQMLIRPNCFRLTGSVPTRSQQCSDYLRENLGWMLARQYVNLTTYPKDRKRITEEMFRSMQQTFANIITKASWMDEETKLKTSKKLAATTYKMGFPDWMLHDTEADAHLQRYRVVNNK